MNLALRDRLAGWLLEALLRPETPPAFRALEEFCRSADAEGAADGLSREEVQALAEDGDLFQWKPSEGVRIRPDLLPQLEELRERLRRLLAAVEAVRHRVGLPPPGADPFARRGESPSPAELLWLLGVAAVLFEQRLFFEAHELLEPAWARARGPTRTVLQGIVQIAVALYHHERRNLRGAARLFEEGIAKLRSGSLLEGLSLDEFRKEAEAAGGEVREQIASNRWRPLPVPRLRF